MATTDATGTKVLPSFSKLKPHEQSAVVLKAEGVEHEKIKNQVNADFGLAYKKSTMDQWFMGGGRLEQALMEYNEALAEQSIKAAKVSLKKSQRLAASVLQEAMGEEQDMKHRIIAATRVLNKYVPDKQVVFEGGEYEDDVPPEIKESASKIVTGEHDGDGTEQPADDAPDSEPASQEAGQ